MLEKYEIGVDPDEVVGSLPNDLKKMIQIVKAVNAGPKIMILDEPTSSLTEAQVRVALKLICQLAAQGVGLVLISHYLAEIFEVCDELTVMRDGEVVFDGPIGATTLPRVVAAMVGRNVEASRRAARREDRAPAMPLMAVESLTAPGLLQDVAFTLRHGEVLGVTGLAGSGLGELARAVFGASVRRASGRVLIEGRAGSGWRPRRFARRRDRAAHQRSVARRHSARFHADREYLLADPVAVWSVRRFGFRRNARTAERNIERLGVRAPGPMALARQLSGGNQQKVLFAKWLETRPKVFVMDEPTIGVDVGAKEEIRKIIDEIAGAGVGILLVTTELDELVLLCDRVLVMFRGAVVGELSGDRVQRETILRASACGEIQASAA